MSNIQKGINQLITSAAIVSGLYSRSPTGQAKAADREANRAQGAADSYKQTLANPNAFTGTPEQQALQRQGMQKLYKFSRDSAVSSRLRSVNLKPTQARLDSYLSSYANQQAEIREENAQTAARSMQASKKAMQRMRDLGMQQVNQNQTRRKFMDYLKNQDSSLGGKVGDLPENIQKQIAKSYNATQRKKLMDEADAKKEAQNGVKKSSKRTTNE